MRTDFSSPIRLADYTVPSHLIENVHLDVTLDDERTRVVASLSIKPNPAAAKGPLILDGDELELESISLDGKPLAPSHYTLTASTLTLTNPPAGLFTLSIVTRLNPAGNTKLMGLYRSSGIYCTQCEAEGFRRITYFPDRPDVMAVFTTRITARADEAPVLLGNGNLIGSGKLQNGFHFTVWHDPHPKPAYLFALVGGKLGKVGGTFTTRSGRKVDLGIYVERGKENRAGYALDALIRSMRWDEEVFGCEYDLDIFNIVAVSDFNMGAMENKGLNIFNDKYVLASPETATDTDYLNIEAIIAHEYFHNWTGNRITCRDWFQLCLKEGLTVFRDQEFTSDERSRAVKRISDVRTLRSQQFVEDSGPLAHPVRPSSYHEINNFYTPTVYEKGAELIRMLKTLIGPADFKKGMDLYLKRCDGTAATIEDFIACFVEASGKNLDRFAVWYDQAGTPRVGVFERYEPTTKTYRLDFEQSTPATPGQPDKQPVVIPIALGLIDPSGNEMTIEPDTGPLPNGVYVLDAPTGSLTFKNVMERPVPSLLRGFSAPIILDVALGEEDLLHLFKYDSDSFNRWQAAQSFAMIVLRRCVEAARTGSVVPVDPRFAEALGSVLNGDNHALIAQIISLPTESDIARDIGKNIHPDAILTARKAVRAAVGQALASKLAATYDLLDTRESYTPMAESAGRRSLRNVALDLLTAGVRDKGISLAEKQFTTADNMTDRFSALSVLSLYAGETREKAMASFEQRFSEDPLVLDKWFALQASIPEQETLDRVKRLMKHPGFSMRNPNRVRSLIGSFAMSNPSQFNRSDGAGYFFLRDTVLELDSTNPQVAARLLGALKTWRLLESNRRGLAAQCLKDIAASKKLSPDLQDIVTRALAEN
jgi:aminopeptidase N